MIHVFTTGGTIDGVGCTGENCSCKGTDQPTSTYVPHLLAQAGSCTDVILTELFVKNSSKFAEEDYRKIVKSCRDAPEKHIVITHGTQTMCDTARLLGRDAGTQPKKTVVLTGALRSIREPESDGLFNLGFALGVVQYLPRGVYVAMHGLVFHWDDVELKTKPKRFVSHL